MHSQSTSRATSRHRGRMAALPPPLAGQRGHRVAPQLLGAWRHLAWGCAALISASALLAHAVAPQQATAGASALDPVQRSAQLSRLATRSVLVGAARAGARLVAVGERGHVVISDDNGRRWKQVPVPVAVTLTAVQFVDERNGWAVGHGGVILYSDDAGQSWKKQLDGLQANQAMQEAARAAGNAAWQQRAQQFDKDGADKPFLAVHFSDARHGLAVGAYGLAFSTDDGGARWTPVFDAAPAGDERHLYAIHHTPLATYVAGEQGMLLRKSAGQAQFVKLETPFRSTVFDLRSSARGSLIAAGLGGKLYRSDDAGEQWSEVTLPAKAALTASALVKEGLVVANEAGQFLLSRDEGRSFQALEMPQPFPVSGLAIAADGQWVMVGPRGVLAIAAPQLYKN